PRPPPRSTPGTEATMKRVWVIAVALTALSVGLASPGRAHRAAGRAAPSDDRPNILLIVVDDQRYEEMNLTAMPQTVADVAGPGVTFSQAVISDPLCCPSRTTILTGEYSHTNGVYGNAGRHGGFDTFVRKGDESKTVALALQGAGYRTGLMGKYLNGYADATYVPQGWDRWFAFLSPNKAAFLSPSKAERGDGYYDWDASDQGTLVNYGSELGDYSTDAVGT